jgi:hypothetical protein
MAGVAAGLRLQDVCYFVCSKNDKIRSVLSSEKERERERDNNNKRVRATSCDVFPSRI